VNERASCLRRRGEPLFDPRNRSIGGIFWLGLGSGDPGYQEGKEEISALRRGPTCLSADAASLKEKKLLACKRKFSSAPGGCDSLENRSESPRELTINSGGKRLFNSVDK